MKKILATLLMLSMILAMLVVPSAAEDEITDTFNPFDENPTISTADDYIAFFKSVYIEKNNYEGQTITMLHDITLNDTTAEDWYAQADAEKLVSSSQNWAHFMGTFDGGNHTLRGVIVEGAFRTPDAPCGIFPYALYATIKNLTVDGFYVRGTNTEQVPVFGRAAVGGLVGHGDYITIDNCTLRNGIVTAVEGAKGALGAVIGATDVGANPKVSITNTIVEDSVKLIAENTNITYVGGLIGYVELTKASEGAVFDLSASRIQPAGSMDEENPLLPIALCRFKGDLGATWTFKNAGTDYEENVEMNSTAGIATDYTVDGDEFQYYGFTDELNTAILASGAYGSNCPELPTFTVTWDIEGVKTTEEYKQGAMPSFKGSTDKPMTDTQLFVFKGWTPELASVTEDVTYTAVYEAFDKVKVTWSVDGVETVEYYKKGEMPTYKGQTNKEQDENAIYSFKGWDKEIVAANEDVTYTAQYDVKNKYKITWIVDGKETVESYLSGVKPSYKGKPTKAEDDEYTYTFTGWDKEIVAASENTTYTAVFEKTAKNATTTGNGETEEKGGCGSSISIGFVSLMVIGMAGAFAFRKKHD